MSESQVPVKDLNVTHIGYQLIGRVDGGIVAAERTITRITHGVMVSFVNVMDWEFFPEGEVLTLSLPGVSLIRRRVTRDSLENVTLGMMAGATVAAGTPGYERGPLALHVSWLAFDSDRYVIIEVPSGHRLAIYGDPV